MCNLCTVLLILKAFLYLSTDFKMESWKILWGESLYLCMAKHFCTVKCDILRKKKHYQRKHCLSKKLASLNIFLTEIAENFRVSLSTCKNIPSICWSWWWNCHGTNCSGTTRVQGTWISSWGVDEVIVSPSTVEAFGPVTAKHCGARIILQFLCTWSLSYFLFDVTLELFCEFRFHILLKKICIFLTLLPFLMLILKTLKS